MEAVVAARCRFACAELSAAVERGVRQIVLLGTGLAACVRPKAEPGACEVPGLHIFEVDHAGSKARACSEGQDDLPVTFVATDFETESLSDALRKTSFQPGLATVFSWLGETLYSTTEAAVATLRFIASMPRESALLFDYAVDRSANSPLGQTSMDALASRVASAGETCRLLLQPEALKNMLRIIGFGHVDDLGPSSAPTHYFAEQPGTPAPDFGIPHLVAARV